MNTDCAIVIGIICLFQVLDIIQLSAIKSFLHGRFKKRDYDQDYFDVGD